MKEAESCVILTQSIPHGDGNSFYRLIETTDPLSDGWIYSLFVTTTHKECPEEEFIFDVSRSREDAADILQHLCKTDVKAGELRRAVSRILSEPFTRR